MEQTKISFTQGAQVPQAARNRQGNDASGAAALPGGFFALLSALDDRVVSQGGRGDVIGDTAVSGLNLASKGVGSEPETMDVSGVAAAWQGLIAPDSVPLPSDVGPTTGARGELVGFSGREGGGASLSGEMLPQGIVAETASLDTAADLNEVGGPGPVAGYGRILSRMQSALAQRAVHAGNGGLPDAPIGRLGQQPAASAPTLVSALHSVGEFTTAVAGQPFGLQLDSVSGRALAPESSASGAAGVAMPSISSRGGGDASGSGRSGEGAPAGGPWSEGAVGFGPIDAGSVDAAAVFGEVAQSGAEELVTDKVAYWVNQKTQNAELTLDRDGHPVEVMVSLSGNEAHVTFRSDQPETRELLDRSMAQLSELLRREGLVLSGMSVGTSAQGSSDAGESAGSRQREGARHTRVVSTASTPVAEARRSVPQTDRTVDIFV